MRFTERETLQGGIEGYEQYRHDENTDRAWGSGWCSGESIRGGAGPTMGGAGEGGVRRTLAGRLLVVFGWNVGHAAYASHGYYRFFNIASWGRS